MVSYLNMSDNYEFNKIKKKKIHNPKFNISLKNERN